MQPRFGLRTNRHDDVWLEGVTLGESDRRLLGRSLATFQLGESGTGEHLFDAAARAGVSDQYMTDLRAFIAEEQEHARLLALVLDSMGMPTLDSHWTDGAFVLIRRLRSLRTELLTLLVAEVIARRYYAALRDGVGDAQLADVFGRIHDDELRHVEFHAATLPDRLREFRPGVHGLVQLLWNALVTAASGVVALDHGRVLKRVGVKRRQFVRDVWGLRSELDRLLFG